MPVERLPIVAVFGSGKRFAPGSNDYRRAHELGGCIARLGCHLLTGGGQGAMAAVSKGFAEVPLVERRGRVLGIVPGKVSLDEGTYSRKPSYPNEHMEIAIYTHLPKSGAEGLARDSRNHINVLTADAIVVLDGDDGTLSEAHLALRYKKPVVAFGTNIGERAGLPASAVKATLDEVKDFLAKVGESSQRLAANLDLQPVASRGPGPTWLLTHEHPQGESTHAVNFLRTTDGFDGMDWVRGRRAK